VRLIDVDPTDDAQLELVVRLVERARAHDDPQAFRHTLEDQRNDARYGGDLEPDRLTVLLDDADEPVGHFWMHVPRRDNLHLAEASITVDPDRRRQGHGSRLLAEVERRAAALGRTTLWVGTADDDERARGFLTRHGFALATRDARRHQRLAEVDAAEIDRLEQEAAEHGRDYVVERLHPPYDDAMLTAMIAVTAAINDAPMGDLTFEDEVYDLDRMRDIERAMELRAERFRRVAARHRETGEVAGHTALTVRPWAPAEAYQWDTSVARQHRGHRLGLALKIAMMRWLAESEPQLEVVETWNNVDNHPMIAVNEALGYRLSRTFAMFEKTLEPHS
jgi:RimJ/RimL family protein N-acetyltransferase